ncbi:MAG: DUF288 domain-containing protein [Verrucomicrobiaceae bacterium]|nr:MAG: DUF288 domain-containing protein [Verrucomicrobiaceae bacterium]
MKKADLTAVVVTSIHAPNPAMKALAAGCQKNGWEFIVAGDSKSPADFDLDGCRFLSLESQRATGLSFAAACPERSYTRKNIGYLSAIRGGATVIVETDDDNHPRADFWNPRQREILARKVSKDGWVNAYRYFTPDFIYPRGLPLPFAREEVPDAGEKRTCHSPIQQGLADQDPDVDAVYRMLFPLPFDFDPDAEPVYLDGGAWCPFNSQNTTFFEEAFPLLYLPSRCNFRMTDIWRSFVAQRVMHAQGHGILFHGATVWQERNEHDLHRDFLDELSGYTHNAEIRTELAGLTLDPSESTRSMMEKCYEVLIRKQWVGPEEESLLQCWFEDLASIGTPG